MSNTGGVLRWSGVVPSTSKTACLEGMSQQDLSGKLVLMNACKVVALFDVVAAYRLMARVIWIFTLKMGRRYDDGGGGSSCLIRYVLPLRNRMNR
jgi:hypothetical protein